MRLPDAIYTYARQALKRLVEIPSVSAEARGLPEAAALVTELLAELGARTELHTTAGAPVVYAEHPPQPGRPTILFYNHYDVQPAAPLEEWRTEPFRLTEKDGVWYGRGVSDDKGELVSRLAALKWYRDEHGSLPFGFKFVVEGEEEVGSPNLRQYVEENAALLEADGCIWEFGGVTATGAPMTYFGLKGIVCLELSVRTAGHDLHSSLGAVVENPIYRLARALTSLRDDTGHVLVEGFYDDVVALTPTEERLLEALPDEASELAAVYGVDGYLGGVTGVEFQRVLLTEPNVNYNGFTSGYDGPGSKTVLPATASAKLDLRLVPRQDPAKVMAALRAHLDKLGFADVRMIELETSEFAARSDADHPFVRATIDALRETYGVEPVVYPNSAGSGPMHPFLEHVGLPVVGLGCSHPGSRAHSPNENVRISDFASSVTATKRLFELFGGLPD
jgi:acetylornithine deacetylase/succinyl-diaminopimelate desuccinylase-like protein